MSEERVYQPEVTSETILFARNLKMHFPVRRTFIDVLKKSPKLTLKAVDGVSFDVKYGEVFTLAGESGCGKTTTGKLVIRLHTPTEGIVGYRVSKEIAEELGPIVEKAKVSEYGHVNIGAIPFKTYKPIRREIQMIWQ
ncbi:MAG: ATP-binding cassette domain-containing protein, partial [Thermosphaera sp.]